MGISGLERVVEKLLVQSIGISRSRQATQAKVDGLAPRSREADAESFAMHSCIVALADFQGMVLREIASCAREYVLWLALSEKIGNLEQGLEFLREGAVEARRDGVRHRLQAYAISALISELDARRERLREARDRTMVDLSERLGEPLGVTSAFLRGHALPQTPAGRPHEGTPAQILARRPDLIAAMHAMEASRLNPGLPGVPDAVEAKLALEQATLRAHCEIERAMRSYQAKITEIVPLRAGLAALEAFSRRLSEVADSGASALPERIRQAYERYLRKDREIDVRGGSYLAAIDLYEAIGAGWESGRYEHEAASDGLSA